MASIAYQLYSARNADINETLTLLAELGIRDVEGFGPMLETPEQTRALLDSHNLRMPTGHFGIDLIEKEPARCIAIAQTLGVECIIAPYIQPDQRPDSIEAWQAMAARVAGFAKPIIDAGLRFAWHNHEFEFQVLDNGKRPIEYLTEASSDLELELDLAWIHVAGESPVAWIERYAGRIVAAHVKDRAADGENADEDGWADLGHGVMDWDAIVAALKAADVQRYVLEHDNPNDVERFTRRSFATASGF